MRFGRLIGLYSSVNLLFFGLVAPFFGGWCGAVYAGEIDYAVGLSLWSLEDVGRERDRIREESPQEALEHCTELIQGGALNAAGLAQLYHERGLVRIALSDYDEALRDFDQALRLNPSFAVPLVEKARVFVARGEFRRAARMLDEAGPLKKDPLVAGSRALIALEMGESGEALALLNKALENDPEEARLYILRAMVLQALQRTHAARSDMARARKLNPAWIAAYERALEEANAVTTRKQVEPDTPERPEQNAEDLLRLIAESYRNGDHEAVCRQADAALESGPEQLRVRLYRARSLLALGRYSSAIPDLTHLIEQAPPRSELFLLRAAAFYGSSRYEEALQDYRSAQELDPASREAREGMLRIQEETGLK